jgi:hypothetical protein
MKIELNPWTIPNYITAKMPPRPRQEGFESNGPKWHISEVDENTLSDQCDKFRKDIFEKAKKIDPKAS